MRNVFLSVLACAAGAATAGNTPWYIEGNSGTSGANNFIGTTDAVPLNFRSNNSRVLSLFNAITIIGPDEFNSVNVLGGYANNVIGTGATACTVFGGTTLNAGVLRNGAYDIGCTVAGGIDNTAGVDEGVLAAQAYATVGGGRGNQALGKGAVVPGGMNNTAGGENSFAGGQRAVVRDSNASGDSNGDEGTFVWSDSSSGSTFTSTAPNQFLVRASGGVGFGTNNPGALMEISGNATFSRPQLMLTQTTSNFARFTMRSTATSRFWTFAGNSAASASSGDRFNFFHSTFGNVMSLTGNGLVGIGTQSPDAYAHVVGLGSFSRAHLRITQPTADFTRIQMDSSSSPRYWTIASNAASAGAASDRFNIFHSSAGDIFSVTGGGQVAIGTTFPAAGFRLDVNGSVRCTSLTQTSSGRFKSDVVPVGSVIDRFVQLNPVEFTWDEAHGGGRDLGFIAEEVAKVFPEAVSFENGEAQGLNYSRITTLAIQAVKEQQARVREGEERVGRLEAENAQLKARLDAIERALGIK